MKHLTTLTIIAVCLFGCKFEFEKELDFNQGYTEKKLVVQGVIQPGYPAYVILSNSEPYFSPINSSSIDDLYVSDALINVSDRNGNNRQLVNIKDIIMFINDVETKNVLDSIALTIPGLYLELPSDLNFDYPYNTIGKFGHQYDLTIYHQGDTLTSTTTIPNEHLMDSLWFKLDEFAPRPNLGNIWFHYSDPDTLGNTIMLEHKRLAHTIEKKFGDNPAPGITPNSFLIEQSSDPLFTKALWGFVRNDFEGLNGTSFDSFFQRGNLSNFLTSEFDDLIYEGKEKGYFKAGKSRNGHDQTVYPDTVLVRISQIDYESYLFLRSSEYQKESTGNPFAEPINLQSNINNGLGGWYGQASAYYKIICKEDTNYTQKHFPLITEIL